MPTAVSTQRCRFWLKPVATPIYFAIICSGTHSSSEDKRLSNNVGNLHLDERRPHRSGAQLKGGPTSSASRDSYWTPSWWLNWRRRINGVPVPRIDEDGALTSNYLPDLERLRSWGNANVIVRRATRGIHQTIPSRIFDYQNRDRSQEDFGKTRWNFLEKKR